MCLELHSLHHFLSGSGDSVRRGASINELRLGLKALLPRDMDPLKQMPISGTGASCGCVRLMASAAVTLILLQCACFTVLAQEELNQQDSGSESAPQECGSNSGGSSCTCADPVKARVSDAAVTEWKATLSEESPNIDLTCPTQDSGAPAALLQGHVCPGGAGVDAVDACLATAAASVLVSRANSNGVTVTLDSLLAQGTTGVVWKGDNTTGKHQKYSLAVPGGAFPLVDQQFFVGCKAATPPSKPVCRVSVAVKARKSTTVSQAVTCAYGSASNSDRQSVTLTPTDNKLTISCGKGGKMIPTDYLTKFCAYGVALKDGSCTPQAFTGLLPGFDQSWWDTKESTSVILTIPAEKFPADEQKFTLGCQYTPPPDLPSNRSDPQSQPTSSKTSVCSVDITITKQPTTTTTSSTSFASSPVFMPGNGGSVVVALVLFSALQVVCSLG